MTEQAKSWYKELWFWLLISPMLTLFVSVPIMLTTAFKGADDRVLDNYYKEGRMINHRFEEQALAFELGISGVIEFDWVIGELSFTSSQALTSPSIDVQFSHPAEAAQDFTITLRRMSPTRYRADLESLSRGRWYLSVRGTVAATGADQESRAWRIPDEINLADADASNRTRKTLIATAH
ncbi:MAG TPA: FixH family protein [Marinagarivorans sp.]